VIHLLLLAASLSWAQTASTPTWTDNSGEKKISTEDESLRMGNLEVMVKDLQSGRPTITGVPTYQNGLNTTGPISISSSVTTTAGQIHNSSQTVLQTATTWANTSFSVCLATLTIATAGTSRFHLYAQAAAISDTTTQAIMYFLVDGQHIPGFDAAHGQGQAMATATSINTMTATALGPSMSAGTHSGCLGFATGTGTSVVPWQSPGVSATYGLFSLEEIK